MQPYLPDRAAPRLPGAGVHQLPAAGAVRLRRTLMNDEQKYRVAGTMLDRMVADYRDDMAKWAEKGNEHAERHVDAATIAQHMEELAVAQPEVTGWILTVAIQRLGDGLR